MTQCSMTKEVVELHKDQLLSLSLMNVITLDGTTSSFRILFVFF